MRFDRIALLLGDDFAKLQNAKVLLLGVGGVGGICLDCLYRSGISDITIVDFDSFDKTNLNRQLHSERFLHQKKASSLASIYKGVKFIDAKIDEAWIESFEFSEFDLIIDAIDDIRAKVALALREHKKLLSSFGSAKRLDPSKIKVADISKSYGDRFGSKIRYELKKRGFRGKYRVVFSSEEARVKEMGSFMGVTGSFGLMLCSEAIRRLCE
ncbi:MAG: ThiF family adenylyltransferase [Sulfuricurvum sp.]|jgi:tRNA A37 threonylcarbamoyladenosine dehydratase